jgi:hypothetical protein
MKDLEWVGAACRCCAAIGAVLGSGLVGGCQASAGAEAARDSGAETKVSNIEAVGDADDQLTIVARINEQRRDAGLGRLQLENDEPPLQSAMRAIHHGVPALDVLRTAMERIAERDSGSVAGWAVLAEDLSAAEFPSAFLTREEPRVAIVIVRYRSHPRYAIFYLMLEDGDAELREG